MKTYYISEQLIYVTEEKPTLFNNMLSFKGHVYTNAINNCKPFDTDICGIKLKDDVFIRIPINTPSITF